MTGIIGRHRDVARAACLTATLMTAAQQAQASSDDAWAELEVAVRQACLNAVGGMITVNTINVDPYGSESYAFAVMVGPEQGATADRVVVCAYDKRKQTAEVSSLF